MLLSLARLGIPLVETLSILGSVEQLLREHKNKHTEESVTTWHLREIVFQSLHRIDPARHNKSEIEKWGDDYARRFGNPNNRIKVIQDDGYSEDLTFSYLTEQFIPDLTSKIMGVQFEQLRIKLISNKDIQRIANEILSVVQFMHVYEIHYDTLFKMASDIALNPPHPWMVKRAFDYSLIQYDLSRASEHAKQMESLLIDGDFPSARHKCMECLDHSCSALLAYYGVFMGVKPFHNLIRILNLRETNPLLWKKLKIRQLEGDLCICNKSLLDLQMLVSKAEKLSGAYKGDKLEALIKKTAEICQLISTLLKQRHKINERISQVERLKKLNKEEFETTVIDIFNSIPNFKKKKSLNDGPVAMCWFSQDFRAVGILQTIQPRVLVALVYTEEPVSKAVFSQILSYFEENRALCNTLFITSNYEFDAECQEAAANATRPNAQNIILLTSRDLQELYNAQDRLRKLGVIMIDFYENV